MSLQTAALQNIEYKIGAKLVLYKFKKTLLKLIVDWEFQEWFPDRFRAVPDAYRVCNFCKVITVYEVEDTNKLTNDKLYLYAMLFDVLNYHNWELNLIVTDRYGENRTWLDLFPFYISALKGDL